MFKIVAIHLRLQAYAYTLLKMKDMQPLQLVNIKNDYKVNLLNQSLHCGKTHRNFLFKRFTQRVFHITLDSPLAGEIS